MRNLPLKIIIALLTFSGGVALTTAWLLLHPFVSTPGGRSQVESVSPGESLPEPSSASLRGKTQAEQDVSEGKFNVLAYGLESLAGKIYRETLLKEYGVGVRNLGCQTTDEDREYMNGYNQVSKAAIERRHGVGVLEGVMERARQESNRFFEELRRKYPENK